ncbi:MAG: FlgD immunoglobulin-like domain containing protein [Balneolaceae bacterium]
MKIRLLFFLYIFTTSAVQAQVVGQSESPFFSIRQNGISSIAANGDTVWISPALTRNIGNSPDWIRPTGIDSIENGIGRVFSVSVSQDTIFAGLGFTSETISGNQPAGYGYYISTNGGEDWRFSDFLLDNRIDEDTTFVYGGQTYSRERIIVPEQSPPYNVSFNGEVLFSANWASGLLRSTNFGINWERIILPPFGESLLTPERDNYFWFDCVLLQNGACIETANVYNSVEDDNLKGFAVLVDSKKRVWYGSAGGINVSENALTASLDSIIWRNTLSTNSSNSLLGRWIIEIKEDITTGKIWMTNWVADQNDRFGIVSTNDGGITFDQHLIGEKILGIGFKDGYVFAAGEEGLFISPDGGNSWQKTPQIKSANTFLKESTEFQAVAVTNDRVWIGTTDGLISTDDLGQTWEITRVNFPLSGGNQYDDDAKSVKAYAYPNPFSPQLHEVTRIRFEVERPGSINIRIFDFGMNLVRNLDTYDASTKGTHEAVWDGVDGKGRNVANGPYFYIIETPTETINGKILLVE